MVLELQRYRFTADEYERMGEAGILSEDDRVELIDGEVVQMAPIGIRHAACVDRLTMLLSRAAPEGVIVRVQNPVRVGEHSEPQPDIALLKPRIDSYTEGHPTSGDILLLVEVADTTLLEDRRVKMPLYGRSGLSEVWLVNLPEDKIEVYSNPLNGVYQRVELAGRGQSLAVPGLPNVSLSVQSILG